MKRLIAGTAAALLAAVSFLSVPANALSAEKAILMDAVTGETLFEKSFSRALFQKLFNTISCYFYRVNEKVQRLILTPVLFHRDFVYYSLPCAFTPKNINVFGNPISMGSLFITISFCVLMLRFPYLFTDFNLYGNPNNLLPVNRPTRNRTGHSR